VTAWGKKENAGVSPPDMGHGVRPRKFEVLEEALSLLDAGRKSSIDGEAREAWRIQGRRNITTNYW
jgi:hypothetical protein